MANVLVRGLDTGTLARLRAKARRRGISVNRLIVETLQRDEAAATSFDDLGALAGTWSKAEGDAFDAAVSPFAEIDPELWAKDKKAAQPKGNYRAKRRRE